jgi:hypothetical protein
MAAASQGRPGSRCPLPVAAWSMPNGYLQKHTAQPRLALSYPPKSAKSAKFPSLDRHVRHAGYKTPWTSVPPHLFRDTLSPCPAQIAQCDMVEAELANGGEVIALVAP